MASRYYDNSDGAQRFQPGTTARADEVDAKLDRVAAGFEQAEQDIDRSIKLPASDTSQEINATPLQRRRRVVGFDASGNLTLLTGFNWRDDWTTATEYFVNDVFRDPATKNIYVTVTRHTSAAALSTDIAAGRVELAINVEDVEAAKAAAEAARNLSMQYRDESRTARDASQTAQGLSETARDKSQAWAETPENTEVDTGKYSALHHAAKASGSASYAASAASAAAQRYDEFDDRYLGPKSSAPATDNDGDPLQVGALYFSTATGNEGMRYWSGSEWVSAYAKIEGVTWADIGGKPDTATRWPTFTEVTDKPSTYPPSTHGHAISNVAGLQVALDGKRSLTDGVSLISSSKTATPAQTYVLTASLTLTLPASPSAGDWVRVSDLSGSETSVIGRNGSNIMGLAEDMTIDSANAAITLSYADATRGWVFV